MSLNLRGSLLSLLGAFVLVALLAVSSRFTVDGPSLRATTGTALIICGLASVVFVWRPWSCSRKAADLFALAAVVALVLENVEFFAAPAIVGSRTPALEGTTSSVAHVLVAAVFAAAALAPRDVALRVKPRSLSLLALVAICAAALGCARLLMPATWDGSPLHEIKQSVLSVPAICLLALAGAAFMRFAARDRDGAIEGLLGAAAVLLATAWTYSLIVPGSARAFIAGSVGLRAGSCILILVAAAQVRSQRRRAEIDECVARERRRFAGLIHDGIAQDLAVIAAYEPRLSKDLGGEHPVTVAAHRALSAARGAIIDLSASDEPTASDALRVVARELALRHGVRIDVEASSESLAGEEREAVVRIMREAVVNAVRHGNSKNITVSLRTDGSHLTMTVDDDGCGLGSTCLPGPRQGYGLREMNGWAQEIGGRLTTQQGAHGGTAVTVTVS